MKTEELRGIYEVLVPSIEIDALLPDVDKYHRMKRDLLVLEPLELEDEKASKMMKADLLGMVGRERKEVLDQKIGLDEIDAVDRGYKTFKGVSLQLIAELEELIQSHGAIQTQEQRRALCKAVDNQIQRFFKKRRKTFAGKRPVMQARNKRIQEAFKAAQLRIGEKIDQDYAFGFQRLSLFPHQSLRIDLASKLNDLTPVERIAALKVLVQDLDRQFMIDDVVLVIEDLFEQPEAYPSYYASLSERANLRDLQEVYAMANAMVSLRDEMIPALIVQSIDEHFTEIELDMEQELQRSRLASWEAGGALGIIDSTIDEGVSSEPVQLTELQLIPFESELPPYIELPLEEYPALFAEQVEEAVDEVSELEETPEFEITMRDMARLTRMMVWDRDTTTERMIINMNRGHIREGSFEWKEEHFQVPDELKVFMTAVYNHPKTKGQIRFMQFYVALWLENYAHWFEDQFHPDVYRAIRSGAIDAGLALNDIWCDENREFTDSRLISIEKGLPWLS